MKQEQLRDFAQSLVDELEAVAKLREALLKYQNAWDSHHESHFRSAASHCKSAFHREMIEAKEFADEVLKGD